jgi:putative acetyltransferase
VTGSYSGQDVGKEIIEHPLMMARKRGIGRLYWDVSLTAEPFFERFGFRAERRQLVAREGVALTNASMAKAI